VFDHRLFLGVSWGIWHVKFSCMGDWLGDR